MYDEDFTGHEQNPKIMRDGKNQLAKVIAGLRVLRTADVEGRAMMRASREPLCGEFSLRELRTDSLSIAKPIIIGHNCCLIGTIRRLSLLYEENGALTTKFEP